MQPHVAVVVALEKFFKKHKHLPRSHHSDDTTEYISLMNSLHEELMALT